MLLFSSILDQEDAKTDGSRCSSLSTMAPGASGWTSGNCRSRRPADSSSRARRTPSAADAGWKDELNLAEFPIAALTDRIPDGQTTLVFEDQLERRDSPPIVRRLTIMGTHKHGLPTSLDDEVLVGLIQLTKRRSNFTDAKVQFSRYELIELLGWPQSGQSYRRIEEALHRWVGVVLMYENAWWDNAAKSWVDENFHVLDNVTLYDRERWRTSARVGQGGQGGAARLEGRQAPPALVELPLERGDLPELPERQPQAARPGVLPQAAAADDQADVSGSWTSGSTAAPGSTSTCGRWPASTSA